MQYLPQQKQKRKTERPFYPALATLELIGAVGNVLANPFSLLVNANDSPAADVNVEAEKKQGLKGRGTMSGKNREYCTENWKRTGRWKE